MEFNHSQVYRNLDAKMKIMGLEALDLLLVLVVAGFFNLFFGHTSLSLPLGVGVPAFMFFVLLFSKKNKPENYLQHLIRYHLTPGFYSAGAKSKDENHMQRKIYENI